MITSYQSIDTLCACACVWQNIQGVLSLFQRRDWWRLTCGSKHEFSSCNSLWYSSQYQWSFWKVQFQNAIMGFGNGKHIRTEPYLVACSVLRRDKFLFFSVPGAFLLSSATSTRSKLFNYDIILHGPCYSVSSRLSPSIP